jgi:hypothetical protein
LAAELVADMKVAKAAEVAEGDAAAGDGQGDNNCGD